MNEKKLNKMKDRHRSFIFTLNNYSMVERKNLEEFSNKFCKIFTFQQQKGEEETPHLQGFLNFKNPISFESLKKIFPRIHWEIARNLKAAQEYCRKADSRAGKLFTNNFQIIEDPLQGKILYPWQRYLLMIYQTKPDHRTIYWFYERFGNTGKTSISKHLMIKYPNEVLYTTGKPADVKHGVSEFVNKFGNNLRMVIFDYCRKLQTNVDFESIQSVKNGIFYSTKYQSKSIIFNCPHVIIFANFKPNEKMLSKDRLKVFNLDNFDKFNLDNFDKFNLDNFDKF
jgi:hypothetical protein